MALADNYRMNGKITQAIQYYDSASKLYFSKWEKKKFLLSNLNKAILYLKLKKMDMYMEIYTSMEYYNRIDNIGLENEILGVHSRYLKDMGKIDESVTILEKVIKSYEADLEKKIYYILMLADVQGFNLSDDYYNQVEAGVEKLLDKYQDGELLNIEGLTFIILAASKMHLKRDAIERSLQLAKSSEDLYRELELVGRFGEIYEQYIQIYQQMGNTDKVDFYKKMLSKFKVQDVNI